MSQRIDRHVPATYDNRGNASWHTPMHPAGTSRSVLYMVPDRIVPVIFVPGIMGSNLIEKGAKPDKAVKWRMDNELTAAQWASPRRGAKFRKTYLRPDVMEVDTAGRVPEGQRMPAEELRRRAWGEVAAMSYEPFLIWLENALNDFDNIKTGPRIDLMQLVLDAEQGEAPLTYDEVRLSCRYRFPVYACGYNWLDDNAASARQLSARIDEIRKRYAKERKKCDKVILVTHSMGGLVARHCSEVLGRRDDIFGIVHGVMPAIGAAAVYRRFKAGTEDTTPWNSVTGPVTASVLGNDGAEMTAVLSSAPGALQLLPTPEYGNGWLKIKDGATEYALPQNGDPYGEIYTVRGKWWSMCEDQRIDPRRKARENRDGDWAEYTKLVDKTETFHLSIKDKYHPVTHAFYGSHDNHRAYGTVTWTNELKRDIPFPDNERFGASIAGTADVMNGSGLGNQTGTTRTASVPYSGGWRTQETQTYRISAPDEAGDGTVPHRSGVSPQPHCQGLMRVNVEHEPAYKHDRGDDNLRACHFTLRAIVRIAQRVNETALRYDE